MKALYLVAFVLLGIVRTPCQVVLFDNSASSTSGSVKVGRHPGQIAYIVGQSFTTPADPLPHSTYSLSLGLQTIPWMDIQTASIARDENGNLGTAWNFDPWPVSTVIEGIQFATFTGHFSLEPSTTYWITYWQLLSLTTWRETAAPVYTGVATPGPWAVQTNFFVIGPWVTKTDSQLLMRLVAVPEPASATLLAAALTAAFLSVRLFPRR